MAITDTGYVSPRVSYTAAPGQTTFAIPFQFFEEEELIVNVNDVRVTSGFTTTGSGDPEGGSLVFDAGLTGGDAVEILRDIVPMRISQFPLSGPFDIAMLNLELDRIILMTQELVTLDTLVRDEFDVLIAEIDTFRDDTAEALAAVPLVLDARDETLLARDAAQLAESNATGSAGAALTSATNANQAKIDAEAARDSASGHRLNAQNAQTAAEAARDVTLGARDTTVAARDVTTDARDTAVAAEAKAEAWASEAEDTPVETSPDKFSGFHWAKKSEGFRDEALVFRNQAETFRDEAQAAAEGFPSGGIVMWSGSAATIPSGWFLCDGTNGTPDLRDRFIVGAGDTYDPGDTGGAAEVTLTEAQMPAHSHTGSAESAGNHVHSSVGRRSTSSFDAGTRDNRAMNGYLNTEAAGAHSHTLTLNNTGGDAAHENRPPYYALCFIMKG